MLFRAARALVGLSPSTPHACHATFLSHLAAPYKTRSHEDYPMHTPARAGGGEPGDDVHNNTKGLFSTYLHASITKHVDLTLTNHGGDAEEKAKVEKRSAPKPKYESYLKSGK